MGELYARLYIGWTCCIISCEVNTGNKRILIQQKIETLALFYSLFRKYNNLSFKDTIPEVYNNHETSPLWSFFGQPHGLCSQYFQCKGPFTLNDCICYGSCNPMVTTAAMILFRPSNVTHDATCFKATCKASVHFCDATCSILTGSFTFQLVYLHVLLFINVKIIICNAIKIPRIRKNHHLS